jgi:hypothetical protein
MTMHFCQDELYALLMALPFLGGLVAWLKSKFHRKHKNCHEAELERQRKEAIAKKVINELKL